MNCKFNQTAKRLISGFVAAATAITMLPKIPAMAEDLGRYPYTLFAGSSAEGSITTTASNFGVNGNVATNGTISSTGNMNINGTKTENAGLDMIYILDKIDSEYFACNNVEEHTEDYVLDELNINISDPTEVLGEAELTGNININTALKAFKDVTLNGEVKNTNDSVIYSKYGDIVIDSTNVNLNGLVYAPFGSVEVKAMNLNLNNVVIIADSIVFDCPNVNANYSTNVADFVGTVSEPLNIPKDEWQYMKDENGNGLPDFFENFENWSKLADSDGDGLPDCIEEYLGSDSNNIDTDGDGLNDYYEVFGTFTDPTKADTDDNGVNDGDEDFDEDGLTNLEEFENKTDPYIADTDGDGLSDGDEVHTYGTDPLVADTDGDGLDDSDEIVLGTNPLMQDTDGNGVIDSKEKFQQTFTYNVENEDCAITEVIVGMECTGNINRTTSVESVMNTDILCTDVVGLVGEPFEIETESEFDKATLTFKIDKDKLGEIPFDNLLFLWYNEEDNEFVELETMLDEANGTASIATTHFSKYMVVDQQAWFDNWREIYARFENLSEKSPSITAICVDCSGSMSSNDPFFFNEQNIKTCYRDLAVQQFIKAMFANDKTSIITFASSALGVCPLTNNKELLNKNAKFYSSGGTNANAAVGMALRQFVGVSGNKSIILLSDGDVNVSNSNLEDAKNNNIKIHAVALGQGANSSALKKCSEKTDGEFFVIKTAAELESIYDKLSANNQLIFSNLPDTDGDGVPDDIEISGIPMPNGEMVFTDPTVSDTDNDGLSDGDEVGKMRRASYFPSDVPDFAVTYKFSFDVTSNPIFADSDYDGIDDNLDVAPHNNKFTGKVTDEYASYDVKFNMDYRNFFYGNEEYNLQLRILGSIFANLAYVDTNIKVDSGVDSSSRDSRTLQELYDLFGLYDVEDYKLADHFPDDDISEMIIGHKKVAFNNAKKDIIIVSVRGTDWTVEEWSSDFDVGADTDAYWDRNNPYWRNKLNHKGFDVAANRLYDRIMAYINEFADADIQKAIYIVGHSRGAAIANILGSIFENKDGYSSFVYTYATPNTTETDEDIRKSYKTIFNIVNEDDLVTYLPMWDFGKYGRTYATSVTENYENKFLLRERDTWEAMFGKDYNYNGHLTSTREALEGLIKYRNELYEFSDDPTTIYTYKDDIHDGQSRIDKYGERISRHCQIVSSEFSGYKQVDTTHYAPEQEVYNVQVRQCPAFLMMVLADLAAEEHHTVINNQNKIVEYYSTGNDEDAIPIIQVPTGFFVAKKYHNAKWEFVWSGADSKDMTLLTFLHFPKGKSPFGAGGMVDAHMPGTYYLLANDSKGALRLV